jgi:glycosyltransferase involved in cell wall biosynthesis
VLTTRIGGAVEIVDESCGVLVPQGDPTALTDALSRLLGDADYRRRLSSGGPARANALCEPRARLDDLRRALAQVAVRQAGEEGLT